MKKITTITLLIIITFSFVFGTEILAKKAETTAETTIVDLTGRSATIGNEAGFDPYPRLSTQIGWIIYDLLALLGVIFMIYIIYAGYLWMGARGNEEQITKSKAIIKGSIIGIIIILAAFAITHFVIRALIDTTGYGAPQPEETIDPPDGS